MATGVRHPRSNQQGVALVELALVIVLVFIMTFAAMEYGWMFSRMQQIASAAREGVREAVLPDATTDEVHDIIDNMMRDFGMAGSGYTVTLSPSDITSLEAGEQLTVNVDVPYANVHLLGLPFLPVPSTLHTTVLMAKEGYE